MKLTYNDIDSARMWAEAHCGDDNPLDVFANRLLELIAQSHSESAAYHERHAAESKRLADEIAERFKIDDVAEF